MKYDEAFRTGINRFLTKATIYHISGRFLVFVEVTEIYKNKKFKAGKYVGIVPVINDNYLAWVCHLGSKYESLPKMFIYEQFEWPVGDVTPTTEGSMGGLLLDF